MLFVQNISMVLSLDESKPTLICVSTKNSKPFVGISEIRKTKILKIVRKKQRKLASQKVSRYF